eukprot:CAMPEP_0168728212 /NCGR_PEP_ID=MMETSP0724-20121128/5568_1 /TAXON_ID=265536 /ORGANISM="Amphiprora sp., Strain CCMP467" /LENGTH=1802 /DNA_ID=CAMNT_0008775051 /DNA_START=155 /DNA_END=5563 /DNA_ORIENTATION=-
MTEMSIPNHPWPHAVLTKTERQAKLTRSSAASLSVTKTMKRTYRLFGAFLLLGFASLVAAGGGKKGVEDTFVLLPEIEGLLGEDELLSCENARKGRGFEDGIHFALTQLEGSFWNNDSDDDGSKGGKKGKKAATLTNDGALVGLRATYKDFLSGEEYQGEWRGLYSGRNIVQKSYPVDGNAIVSIQVKAFGVHQGLEFLKLELDSSGQSILLGSESDDDEATGSVETTFLRPSPTFQLAGFRGYTSRESGALANIGFFWADYAVLGDGTTCEAAGQTCSMDADCCSPVCESNGICCAAGGQICAQDADCCSTVCQTNGLCTDYFDPSIPVALAVQTETFEDTIYAQPIESQTAIGTHTVIEGFVGRNRIQTDLLSRNPGEEAFFDKNYHLGRPEVVQLEGRELVHYYHPQNPRKDGVKTDGLVRHVIMDSGDIGENPRNLQSGTGTYSNRFGLNVTTYGSHVLFFETNRGTESKTWNADVITWVVVGEPNINQSSDGNPIKWNFAPLAFLEGANVGTCDDRRKRRLNNGLYDIQFVDKYVSQAWTSNLDTKEYATYDPRKAVEHILIYLGDDGDPAQPGLLVLTLLDNGTGFSSMGVSYFPMPSLTARVLKIDWDPTTFFTDSPDECSNCIANIVVVDSVLESNQQSATYKTYSMNRDGAGNIECFGGLPIVDPCTGDAILAFSTAWNNNWDETEAFTQSTDRLLDYASLRQVNTLYEVTANGGTFYMTLAILESPTTDTDPQIFIIALYKVNSSPPVSDYASKYVVVGTFPLLFPYQGGSFVQLSGGTSKFGGMRFIANDEFGNLFMMRQRGFISSTSPYDPPIYGLFDSTGDPMVELSLDGLYNPFPSGTSSTTNLNEIVDWQFETTSVDLDVIGLDQTLAVAALLQTALAFGSSEENEAQGIWLGSGFQAAYAFKRFGLDSSHVVVRQSGTPNVYSSIAMHKNPIDKTWHQKVIAQQTEPAAPGLNESGDHYQAIVTPVNVDGNVVIINDGSNPSLEIEVRADSPCTVTDDTNNYYYDIDRYTSFLAKPDPTTGKLSLVVKAEAFAQVLYVRLVDVSALQQSDSDPALQQGNSDTTAYDWLSINIAAEAQQRMGNDGNRRRRLQSTTTPALADETVYVDSSSLEQSNTDNSWDLKGTYDPMKSKNYDSVGTYFNTAGQNMITLSGDLSDPTLTSSAGTDDSVDPLYTTTAVPTDSDRQLVTASFSYGSGDVDTSDSRRFLSERRHGRSLNALNQVSHALHDAFHWLQHAEDKFYKDLGSDGVSVIHEVESVTVTISKSIMKLVNGVDQELQQIVQTVEEYASIIVNVIVTLVEDSFIFQFIELMIALISLFAHLQDIQDLAKSFKDQFYSYVGNQPTVDNPSQYSDEAMNYVGPNNLFDDALGGVSTDDIVKQASDDLLDNLMNHPFGSKIVNKLVATLTSEASLPIEFNMDETSVEQPLGELNNLISNLLDGAAQLSEELIDDLVNTVADHASNPKQVYEDLTEKLGTLANDFVADELDPIFQFAENAVDGTPQYAMNLLEYKDYMTLKIPMLADLCKLLGIGTVSGSKLTLSGHEFVFFPMAMLYWVAVYMKEGKSIKSINDLTGGSGRRALALTEPQKYNIIRLSINVVIDEFRGLFWLGKNLVPDDPIPFSALRAWSSWTKGLNNYIFWALYPCPNVCPNIQDTLTGVYRNYKLLFATLNVAKASLSSSDAAASKTPSLTPQLIKAFNGVSSLAYVGVYTYNAVESESDPNQIVGIDLGQTMGLLETFYFFAYGQYPEEPPNVDLLGAVFVWDLIGPVLSTVLQIKAIEDAANAQ